MSDQSFAFASRMNYIDASGIRKVFDLAAKMTSPINLSIGQPDFDVPEPLKAEAMEAIRMGHNRYTQTQGTVKLRSAIANACRQEFGWSDAADRPYLVTSGVSGGLLLAVLTMVSPGDEVVFTDPYFVMYSHLVHMAGGTPVAVDCYPDFRPNVQRIADAITDKTKLLIINSPANPTGVVYSEQELKEIAKIADKHGLLVVSDEIYNQFCYDQPFVSMASLYPNTLLLRGFSKSYAMTGWRIGWATGPAAVLEKMTMLQQYTFVCAPSMAQEAAALAMETDMSEQVKAYRAKRDMVVDILSPKLDLIPPAGAFYAFAAAPGGDATEFVRKAIEKNVLVIPGNVFSTKDTHFRISYATNDADLRRGLEILAGLA